VQGRFNARGNGGITVVQHLIFSDARTGVPANKDGAGAMIILYSGFQIDEKNEKTADGKYLIKVTRTALANNGAEKGLVADATEQKAEVK
jgi:hypothetical protein